MLPSDATADEPEAEDLETIAVTESPVTNTAPAAPASVIFDFGQH